MPQAKVVKLAGCGHVPMGHDAEQVAKLILEALHGNQVWFINSGHGVHWAPEIPIWLSLVVIVVTLGIATVASLAKSARDRRRDTVTGKV